MENDDSGGYASGNMLLDRLPPEELKQLLPLLTVDTLPSGFVVYPGYAESDLGSVYFPITCIVSMLTLLKHGDVVESGAVGREGLAPYQVIFGTRRMRERWICQMAGSAAAIPVADLWAVLPQLPVLQLTLQRFGQSFLTSVSQSVACNAQHTVSARCAKWLLFTQDRTQRSVLYLTHEYLSDMLGVRRASVSLAASAFQDAGLIKYMRGRVTIIDRAGLEAAACECYAATTREYGRLMDLNLR